MVEKTRNTSESGDGMLDRISKIVDYFAVEFGGIEGRKVAIYSTIAGLLNELDTEKQWTWKYISNVNNHHIIASKRFARTVEILHRMIIGKVIYRPAPVCLKCGQVHVTKKCMANNGNGHRPRRVAIRIDSPESAARTIEKHFGKAFISELIELLDNRHDYY